MNILVHRTARLVGGVLVLAFLTTGCRTYGGYGSTEAMLGKIEQTAQRFADDYQRAQGERDALQRAASSNPVLAPVAERFAAVVEHQGMVVEAHEALAQEASASNNPLFAWVGPDAYRTLHRTYGALISDQQVVHDRYAEVLLDLQEALGHPASMMVPEEGRYQVAPHFYTRIALQANERSVSDILAQARTDSATLPSTEEQDADGTPQ